MNTKAPLICIVGQTATGKSTLALRIAKEWGGEIICADSWTVRKEMDIGSAKPTMHDRSIVPHHLLDIVGPDENFNAAIFKDLAQKTIDDILSRGKIPILVGGTGLYIDSVIYNYSFANIGDKEARKELDSLSIAALLNKIENEGIDIGDVDTRNKRRLVRLIETNGTKPTKQNIREHTMILGMRMPKEKIINQIEKRVDLMLQEGLEKEVKNLAEKYGWESEGMKGIGYSQWREYFLGHENISQVRQNIIQATIGLSKRQKTWFQRNKSIQWFDAPVKWTNIVELVTTFLSTDIPI